MSYVLRDYQQKASNAAVSFFANRAKKNNAIMVLPTGAGKSLVIADIASRLEGHTLVFQPSKEILEQNYLKLCSYGVLDCSIYSASFGRKEISRITFAIGLCISLPGKSPRDAKGQYVIDFGKAKEAMNGWAALILQTQGDGNVEFATNRQNAASHTIVFLPA